jgi:predicted PurR-regulated permease PerM
MNTTQTSIATTSSPVITVSLESVGVFTGICVSISVLGTLAVKLVNNLNNISTSITQIKEDLKEHANNAEKIRSLEHKLDLHVQDYINRKDTVTLLIAQITQVVEHRTNRLYTSMKDIENFLQMQGTFKIREFQDLRKMEEEDPFNKL